MKDMVLIFVLIRDGLRDVGTILVKKARPEWMAGKLNLPGGKVEPDDCGFYYAATRELKEETGITVRFEDLVRIGDLSERAGNDAVVRLFGVIVQFDKFFLEFNSKKINGEQAFFVAISKAMRKKNLVENLYHLIPYSCSVLDGWRQFEWR
jgi:8-oxo-dGTP pyrophosphatase MutT (NUDIX family)